MIGRLLNYDKVSSMFLNNLILTRYIHPAIAKVPRRLKLPFPSKGPDLRCSYQCTHTYKTFRKAAVLFPIVQKSLS